MMAMKPTPHLTAVIHGNGSAITTVTAFLAGRGATGIATVTTGKTKTTVPVSPGSCEMIGLEAKIRLQSINLLFI